MKKNLGLLTALFLGAAMSNRGRDLYDLPPSMSSRTNELLDKHDKERNHRLNPVDLSEREFCIKGERIMAHDRRTALKIYANRHPETKKRKK